jgi:hypothetical protein
MQFLEILLTATERQVLLLCHHSAKGIVEARFAANGHHRECMLHIERGETKVSAAAVESHGYPWLVAQIVV